MKFQKKKIFLRLLSMGILATPIVSIVSCNSVKGELDYKIIGLNSDGTDYIVDVIVNNQFIAKVIEKNKDNLNALESKINEKILDQVKDIFPQAYKDGQYKDFIPSVKKLSKTHFKIFIPIKKVVKNLSKYADIIKAFSNKYNKDQALEAEEKKFRDELFMPNLQSLGQQLQDFLTKKYDVKNDKITKNDYINFNYMGIKPYMAGKLTDDILKNVLGLNSYTNVQDFLGKKFQNKKDQEQIKETINLPNTFELTNFRGRTMDIFFYITNIQEKNNSNDSESSSSSKSSVSTSSTQYKLKDKSKGFNQTKHDKADVYFSLFLKKELVAKNTSPITVEIKDVNKIEETSVESIFSGLKIGTEISRVVEVDPAKTNYGFTYDNPDGKTKKELENVLESKLFVEKEKKNSDDEVEKNSDKEILYTSKMLAKYKSILTFDITNIETKNASDDWVKKTKNDIVEIGDRVTYTNNKIEYLGLPFDRGEAINNKAYNGKSGFIGDFDKQMEGMSISKHRIITPIFPLDYSTEALKGKLVKFIIKVNAISRRKDINEDFLKENKLKNLKGEDITTKDDFELNIQNLFKAKLFEELWSKYLSKATAKVPYVLIESFYSQIYMSLILNSRNAKNKINSQKVLVQANQRAKMTSIINEFFKVNGIKEDNFEKNRNILMNKIYKQIMDE